jgi:hypothetical protein
VRPAVHHHHLAAVRRQLCVEAGEASKGQRRGLRARVMLALYHVRVRQHK